MSGHAHLYDRRWRARREQQLREHPLCRLHMAIRGQVAAATIADHVVPHRGDPVLFEGELTATQQEVVRFARDNESLTPTKLAEFRQISKSTAHEALQALVAKGAMRVYAGKYYPNGGE